MKTNLAQGNVFYGKYNEQMPSLIKKGLQPYSSKDIMQKRIEALQSNNQDEINFWLDNYWDTSDGLVYFNNNLIVELNSELLTNINPESKLNDGFSILTKEEYNESSKKYGVIKREDIILRRNLTKEEAKEHLIWLKLAQDDKALLSEYVDSLFAKAKEIYNYNENMSIYFPDDQENPVLSAWFLSRLDDRSVAVAGCHLDDSTARLFGVRAENLDQILGNIAIEQGFTNSNELRRATQFYKGAKEGSIDLKLLQ